MADRNEPGGGVVPGALAELRRASAGDRRGVAIYLSTVVVIAAVICIVALN